MNIASALQLVAYEDAKHDFRIFSSWTTYSRWRCLPRAAESFETTDQRMTVKITHFPLPNSWRRALVLLLEKVFNCRAPFHVAVGRSKKWTPKFGPNYLHPIEPPFRWPLIRARQLEESWQYQDTLHGSWFSSSLWTEVTSWVSSTSITGATILLPWGLLSVSFVAAITSWDGPQIDNVSFLAM